MHRFNTYFILVCILLFLTGCKSQSPKVIIQTTLGEIVAEIYLEQAPVSAGNFLSLVDDGLFDAGATFYRVTRKDNQPNNPIKIDIIQGGLRGSQDNTISPIRHETTHETGLKHLDGSLSMARSEPGTASSEFFVCIGDQPELNFGGKRNPDGVGFAVFGRVIKGMDIVKQIQQQKDNEQYLVEPIRIMSVSRMQ